ncbi:drim domain-containing protein [Citrus sinensis]|uniref:Drim domain-containing protein n=1 Tax=Citrus sinensis TaxID=2711 RepID=A0ACB8KJU5_CITSI|nr:drim domain-containing protein [Citrus sinensis]
MAHSLQKGRCSRGVYRLVLFLVGAVLVGYNVGPPFHARIKKNSSVVPASCPCFCECSSELGLALPLGPNNDSFTEMEKDTVALLSEELALQKSVANETLQRSKELIMDARKASSHYQREAEKCTAGIETCEEARERAEKDLGEESRLSALWEKRAREHGWKDDS